MKPDYPEALANLGLALQAMGRREEAARAVSHWQSNSGPASPAAHNNLGNLLRESGRHG